METDRELLSVLAQIAKAAVEITYYLADGARKWHAFVDFLYSAKAAIVASIGVLVGYLLGRR